MGQGLSSPRFSQRGRFWGLTRTEMITLPQTPIQPVTIRGGSSSPLVNGVFAQRSQLTGTTNITSYISQLEDYLSTTVELLSHECEFSDLMSHASTLKLSESVPWKFPVKMDAQLWSLRDEIVTVCCNLSLGYALRSEELMVKYVADGKEDESIWLNVFKLLKNGLKYVEFVKQFHVDSNLWITSMEYVRFVEAVSVISLQYSFLSKCLWKLKSTEFEVQDDTINYSTLGRVAVYVKDELVRLIKEARYQKFGIWSDYLECVLRLVQGIVGALVSVENYKQDKVGVAIGFVDMAIDNISTKSTEDDDDEDDKFKRKFATFKKKLNDKSKKLKSKKLKINTSLYNRLPTPLQSDYTHLLQLIELLQLKYNLDNNNLKFEEIAKQDQLVNFLPLGRSVPFDIAPWRPGPTPVITTSSAGYY